MKICQNSKIKILSDNSKVKYRDANTGYGLKKIE